MIERMLAILSLVPLPFLKPAWTSGSSHHLKHSQNDQALDFFNLTLLLTQSFPCFFFYLIVVRTLDTWFTLVTNVLAYNTEFFTLRTEWYNRNSRTYSSRVTESLCLITLSLWRRQWPPTPVLLPGKSHGQRSLVGCSPWGHKMDGDLVTKQQPPPPWKIAITIMSISEVGKLIPGETG